MILEMIENVLIHFFIRAILVVVSFVALLPLKGKKGLLTITNLLPILST